MVDSTPNPPPRDAIRGSVQVVYREQAEWFREFDYANQAPDAPQFYQRQVMLVLRLVTALKDVPYPKIGVDGMTEDDVKRLGVDHATDMAKVEQIDSDFHQRTVPRPPTLVAVALTGLVSFNQVLYQILRLPDETPMGRVSGPELDGEMKRLAKDEAEVQFADANKEMTNWLSDLKSLLAKYKRWAYNTEVTTQISGITRDDMDREAASGMTTPITPQLTDGRRPTKPVVPEEDLAVAEYPLGNLDEDERAEMFKDGE